MKKFITLFMLCLLCVNANALMRSYHSYRSYSRPVVVNHYHYHSGYGYGGGGSGFLTGMLVGDVIANRNSQPVQQAPVVIQQPATQQNTQPIDMQASTPSVTVVQPSEADLMEAHDDKILMEIGVCVLVVFFVGLFVFA